MFECRFNLEKCSLKGSQGLIQVTARYGKLLLFTNNKVSTLNDVSRTRPLCYFSVFYFKTLRKNKKYILPLAPNNLGTQFQSAIFSFQSLLVVACLMICTCTYIRQHMPSLLDKNKKGSV